MDWVPDLIGNPPRREENGGDETQKTAGLEKRRLVEQIESETEIAVAIESQTQSFETEICEIEIVETQSDETRETEIVELDEIEIETES